jgi:predicted aspartyl protease
MIEKERPFFPRLAKEPLMGEIRVQVTIVNALDRTKRIDCVGLVDTGAFGLVLPRVRKSELGEFLDVLVGDVEVADQRIVEAEMCGPVLIQIDGFRRVPGEVVFLDMQPGPRGYEPLIGYTVLEQCNLMIDMKLHRLVARERYLVKRTAA